MKTSLSILLAAGAAGVAFAKLSNAAFLATVRGDLVLAVAASAAIVYLAIYDYSRRSRPLVPATSPVARPAATVIRPARAYGIRRQSALVERSAA